MVGLERTDGIVSFRRLDPTIGLKSSRVETLPHLMNQLNSLQLAAVVLKSLPAEQAVKMAGHLDTPELSTLLEAARTVPEVSISDLEKTFDALDEATRELQTVNAEPTVASYFGQVEVPLFDFLEDTKLTYCQQLLEDEHPRNIAIVLAHLSPDKASDILQSLDPALRLSVVKRLCESNIEADEEAADLRFTLKLRLQRLVSLNSTQNNGLDIAAKLLSCISPDAQESLLTHINQDDPDLARNLEASVFQFDDLQQLSDEEIVVLLKNVDTSLWAPALRIADFATQSKVLKNFGERPAKFVNREIAEIDQVDHEVSLKAQKRIINSLLKLRRLGKIDSQ